MLLEENFDGSLLVGDKVNIHGDYLGPMDLVIQKLLASRLQSQVKLVSASGFSDALMVSDLSDVSKYWRLVVRVTVLTENQDTVTTS